ncbi:MAG TPA: hypothetical protein VGQ38_12170 [Gaiellaceae bacterium]|nr:hypothetical protein [Gaiellaceae bacterium]
MTPDEITLTLPRGPEYQRVAHLVLSGLAVRLDLTIENLEDLELALDAVLDRTDPNLGDVTMRLAVRDSELEAKIGPLSSRLLNDIDRDAGDGELGIRRVLDSTVDDVHVDGEWVLLTKKVGRVG